MRGILFLLIVLICAFVATAQPQCNQTICNNTGCNYNAGSNLDDQYCYNMAGCDYCGPDNRCHCGTTPVPEFTLVALIAAVAIAGGVGYYLKKRKAK